MKLAVITAFAIASAALFLAGGASDFPVSSSASPSSAPADKAQDAFKHAEPAHKKVACASCHKAPTSNWQTASGYPNVSDYPGHASCFNCHQKDIFSGNQPKFCGVCHTNPGPRGAARIEFPDRRGSNEFRTIFPHNVHQDFIATNRMRRDSGVSFMRASFRPAADDNFNNCTICHSTPSKLPAYGPRTLLRKADPLAEAAAENFVPKPAFFKDSPNSHASCFQCHYQNAKPVRTDCAGCHELTASYKTAPLTARYSLKFDHSYKDHVNKDCTTCHVRITQTASLKNMKDADVPMLTCSTSSCHQKQVAEEIGKRDASIASKTNPFQCVYCHTPEIGRYPTPPSHKAK